MTPKTKQAYARGVRDGELSAYRRLIDLAVVTVVTLAEAYMAHLPTASTMAGGNAPYKPAAAPCGSKPRGMDRCVYTAGHAGHHANYYGRSWNSCDQKFSDQCPYVCEEPKGHLGSHQGQGFEWPA